MNSQIRGRHLGAALCAGLFSALSALAPAQLVLNASHNTVPPSTDAGADVTDVFGSQTYDYYNSQSDLVNGSGMAAAFTSATDIAYNTIHTGTASAKVTNVTGSMGLTVDGTYSTTDVIDGGGYSYGFAEAVGQGGTNVAFLASSDVTLSLLASAIRSNVTATSPGDYATSYYTVSIQDRTTGIYLFANYVVDHRDQTGGTYNPLNTTVSLIGGHYYELSVGAFDQAVVPLSSSAGSMSSLDYSWHFQLGQPTSSVPAAPAAMSFVTFAGRWASRRRRTRA